ncbi:MAG TPA: RHS repeat-associated core domain-containing protein, partial [Actinomycetota bacterium]|nr:RHS repeat-associated core domain-containing protein [Actinomycetota bacterium]
QPRTTSSSREYGWLGTKQRPTDPNSGIILMGVRLYTPTAGRFLQIDPVKGGNANDYDYCTADPINCYDLDGRLGWLRKAANFVWKHKWDIALTAASFTGVGAAAWTYRAYRVVRVARTTRGMAGGIRATRATSWLAGRMWTGIGSRSTAVGRVSSNRLRQYRNPAFKSRLGIAQSNFESRAATSGRWSNNYHVRIWP